MLTVFGIFFILLYFSHSNSNFEAQIGLIVLQTWLCHDKVFEVNVFRLCFGIFIFVDTKMASQELSMIKLKSEMLFNCLILKIFAKIYCEYLDISPYRGLAIFICFWTKQFSYTIAKRTGFEVLVMS